ncbi:MAG: 30S ribosomal protein S18 [Myxococcota bacterium]
MAEKENFRRRKVSRLYSDLGGKVDYNDPANLRYFITERGKIVPRRISKVSAKDQRMINRAVKRARALGLLPFVIG